MKKIIIGEVLGDAENYATVVATVTPILKNVPSKYWCVVSKTNVISAELIASKLTTSKLSTKELIGKITLVNVIGNMSPKISFIVTVSPSHCFLGGLRLKYINSKASENNSLITIATIAPMIDASKLILINDALKIKPNTIFMNCSVIFATVLGVK